MTKQAVEIKYVNYKPGARKIVAVMTDSGRVYSVDQIRNFIDDKVAVIVVGKDGNATTVTKSDETGIKAVRDDSTENNLDSLDEFDL